MKKLFRIKIEDEGFVVAENEQEAIEQFWDRKRAGDFEVDSYLNDITTYDEIDEVEDVNFEDK